MQAWRESSRANESEKAKIRNPQRVKWQRLWYNASRNGVEHVQHRTRRRLIAFASADGVGENLFKPRKVGELGLHLGA
jgi:hypothetical protein